METTQRGENLRVLRQLDLAASNGGQSRQASGHPEAEPGDQRSSGV